MEIITPEEAVRFKFWMTEGDTLNNLRRQRD
jgi:hypothetical protein